MSCKQIVILGSTGSIGINTLKVIERFPNKFKVVGLSAYSNFKLLETQIKQFSPTHVAVNNEGVKYLRKNINTKRVRILDVSGGLEQMASLKNVDIVVIGMGGSRALLPFLAAIREGKIIAPANKEALVIAGEILMREAKKYRAKIIPIDSEQSAIFQCLDGRDQKELKKVYLTASGGALLNVPASRFDKISVEQILKHPKWKMGKKITVDSATLMNKGFEVMEAKALFDLRVEDIEVVIHPEAVIHSMVEFRDGSIIAQLGATDMRLPIQYALTYPQRFDAGLTGIDFFKLGKFHFERPNFKKFPSLALAIDVAKQGGTAPSVLNAADEEAVEYFLNGKIKFTQIYEIVEKVVRRHIRVMNPDLREILNADQWAREAAQKMMDRP